MAAKELDLSYRGLVDLETIIGELLQYRNSKKLLLQGNKLRTLPHNLSFFKDCTHIDISDNPITNIALVIKGLSSLPKLTSLKIDLPSKTKERDIAALTGGLSGLKLLNDTRIDGKRPGAKLMAKKDKEIQEQEQAVVETVGKSSKNIINQEDIENYNTMVECFKYLYGEVSEELSESVGSELSGYFKGKIRDLSRLDHNLIGSEATELLNLKALFKVYLFSLNRLSVYINDHVDSRVSKIIQFIHNTFGSVFDGIWDIVSKGIDLENGASLPPDFFSSAKKKQPQVSALFQSLGAVQSPPAAENPRVVETNTSSRKDFRLSSDGLLAVAPKKMTFTQVDELVGELIDTKMQSDVNHLLNRLPKKTMEGHLNELFMNKFGVKKVVLENLQSFLYYLKVYSPVKTRLRAFLHVLRNECEEEFLHALKCVEKTIGLLLKLFLNANNPYLTEKKVDAVLRKKFETAIDYDEAVKIVEYLYSRQDAKEILAKVDDFLAKQHHEEPEALTRKELYLMKEDQQAKKIKYKEFNWIVTDYILDSHLRFLSPFVRVFRSLDSDNTGYIDETQFRELLDCLNPDGRLTFDVEDMLIRVDPYSFNQMSFSTCACFVSEMIINEQDDENVLENLE